MDFFQHQERARRKTGVLVVLFGLAVICTVVGVNLVLVPILSIKTGEPVAMAVLVTVCVVGVIIVGSLIRVTQMASGGRAVAEAMGGRPLDPGTNDPRERRALNVVEEMAIASGLPVPPIYVLPDKSINAFAAGRTPQDSVIGLTEGTIERLTRDELQGVVGHEFSHIFHQDTRLNMKLVGLLGGILALSIIGRVMLRGGSYSRRGKETGAIMLIGLALFVLGGIGYFFGRLIQCAVSRQREFLADASAVQYTRNPDGLAGALEKISHAGSKLESPRAAEFSHFLFASGLDSLFSTHPDVNERIKRIRNLEYVKEPIGATPRAKSAMETLETPMPGVSRLAGESSAPARAVPPPPVISAPAIRMAVGDIGRIGDGQLDYAASMIANLPGQLLRAAHDPFAARAVILGMLLSRDPTVRGKQIDKIRRADQRLMQNVLLLEPAIGGLAATQRLPLLEICASAMVLLSPHQYAEFRSLITATSAADEQIDRFEWSVHAILRRAVEKRGASSGDEYALLPTEADMAMATAVLCYSGARRVDDAERAWMAARGANNMLPRQMPSQQQCTLDALDASLRALDRGKPSEKRATLAGCVAAVCADGITTADEAELLRSVSDCIGVPMPPIVMS